MSALRFERLRVQRMPGIRDGGFELDGLAAGLNIVHGPNASGKTTTARAIEALLWPNAAAPPDALLTARFRHGDSPWDVDVAGGRGRYQRDGADAAGPALPPADGRDRYHLSLDELLRADDAGFARSIARESAGGYDLAAAARILDPRRAASRCSRELAALREARARLDEARRHQQSLFDDERRLHEMERRLEGRGELANRARVLECAIEHSRAAAEAASAGAALAAFDPRMERMRAGDDEELVSNRDRLDSSAQERRTVEAERARAVGALEGSALPGDGLPGALLPSLRQELQGLREAEQVIAAREQSVRGCEVRLEAERRALDGALDEERLAALDLGRIRQLGDFVREVEQAAAARRSLEARLRDLSPGPGTEGAVREDLENGARLLQQWLRTPAPGSAADGRLRLLGTIAAAALIVAGLALFLVTPLLALAAAVGVVLLVLIQRRSPDADVRRVYQTDFGKTGLEAPADWSEAAVEARLAKILAAASLARLDEERGVRHAEVLRQIQGLEPREAELSRQREEVAAILGIEPRVPDGALGWLVERVGRWQAARTDLAAAVAELGTAREQLSAGLARVRDRVAPYGYDDAGDTRGVAAALEDLDGRQRAFETARQDLRIADQRLERLDEERVDQIARRLSIYTRLGLDDEELATAQGWAADLDRYGAARDRSHLATARRAEAETKLRGAGDDVDSFFGADEHELADRLERLEEQRAELERLHEEAIQIRTRIEDAKKMHAVEDALAEMEQCEDALRQARERDTRSALGAVLLDHVQRATRDQHLPRVFHRARELFARVTHGRYRLDFDDGDAPSFRAYDASTGRGHPLGELSSATRIQLLMAVRLAFVESQEGDVRLPLVLDETLANSDDGRAHAIMEAVLEFAAGRQVFYLTAQPDEVGKWRGLLDRREGTDWAVIDLAAARKQATRLDVAGLRVVGPPAPAVPHPGALDHAAYGEVLGVCRLGPLDPVDSVHLWYLVEEPVLLHQLVADLRVERWGALRLLVDHGGSSLVEAGVFARIRALAGALEAALDLRRVGRGRPVDRAVLESSGMISAAFIDTLDEICRASGGDAERLMAALENGEVKRFQARVRENLQDYLEEHGYLDRRERLGPAEIRARTLAAVAPELAQATVDVDAVDRLLTRLEASLSEPRDILAV
jgi:uncharacterized protein YhaN